MCGEEDVLADHKRILDVFILPLSNIFSDQKTYRNLEVAKLKCGAKLDKKEWYNAVSFERFCV